LAPLDAAGDARPRPARRPRRRRTRRRAAPEADPAHLQRAPAAAHPSGPRPSTPPRRPGDLVPMATTTPIPRPYQPLPPPSGRTSMIDDLRLEHYRDLIVEVTGSAVAP